MIVKPQLLAAALGVGCLISMQGALAQEPANNSHESGMRVYVDPETGRLVSAPVTAEQRAAAASDAVFSQDASKAVEAVAADGSKMYLLNGEFELALGVQLGTDGERHFGCSDAAHAALAPAAHASAHAPPAANDR
jgi:hypothetical protein